MPAAERELSAATPTVGFELSLFGWRKILCADSVPIPTNAMVDA
jgi:hypothetical protein